MTVFSRDYVVSGPVWEFFSSDNEEWKKIEKGDAFMAPQGMQHAIKNCGKSDLVLFSTFSPATK